MQICLPSRRDQANRLAEQRLKNVQTTVLRLAIFLLLVAHAPGSAHALRSLFVIASPGVPEGSRGRKNVHAEVIEVTVHTQLCNGIFKRHRLWIICHVFAVPGCIVLRSL